MMQDCTGETGCFCVRRTDTVKDSTGTGEANEQQN